MGAISDGIQAYLKDRYGDDLSPASRKEMGDAIEDESSLWEAGKLKIGDKEKQEEVVKEIVDRL